jgi:hypothetical protein
MALFRAAVKTNVHNNNVQIPKGTSVEFISIHGSPLSSNGGKDVIDAFQRQYGVDIKKACIVASAFIEITKLSK